VAVQVATKLTKTLTVKMRWTAQVALKQLGLTAELEELLVEEEVFNRALALVAVVQVLDSQEMELQTASQMPLSHS
jgi:hypothetical protein